MEKKPGEPRWVMHEHGVVSLIGIIESILSYICLYENINFNIC